MAGPTPNPVTYVVQRGDSLWKIAHQKFKRHGLTVDALKKANGLKSDYVKPGQTLLVPVKKGIPLPAGTVGADRAAARPSRPAAATTPPPAKSPPRVYTMTITVVRDIETRFSTTGRFTAAVPGLESMTGFTLEPPSKEMAVLDIPREHPRIPPDTYSAIVGTSEKNGKPPHGKRVFKLERKHGRRYIQIHVGNKPFKPGLKGDTTGCILPGSSRRADWVSHSMATMGKLLALYDKALKKSGGKGVKVCVVIKEAFANKAKGK